VARASVFGVAATLDFQRPQTVLKTAGLASATIHQRPLEFDRQLAYSTIVRRRPLRSGKLALILAVSLTGNKSLRPFRYTAPNITVCRCVPPSAAVLHLHCCTEVT
jgi:hypothetical protein